jgi:hypothetical protein
LVRSIRDFPRRDPPKLFFPTVHLRDGGVHPSRHPYRRERTGERDKVDVIH